ncbi:alanyl-tRNA editing protein [Cognatiyoonia sp.]|uniref:alanyl-tRNA editing protein n=1 Tax=Cognatiyoonia sp. TaxID=2211652 RepID=UPI003F698016
MTKLLFHEDAYLRECDGTVTAHTDEGGIIVDQTVFYPTSGGQPGDNGMLVWDGGSIEIAIAMKGPNGAVVLIPAEPVGLPAVGQSLMQVLDWDRRYRHMRMHTALHLLSVVIPLAVTGGSIGAEKSRLDFDMPTAPANKDALNDTLNRLIDCDFLVSTEEITEVELDAQPTLVKTMSVQPPRGAGLIRLVRIGEGDNTADLQPCGGTHVRHTKEIGHVRIGKVEKKGRQNRRVNITLEA